MDPNVIVDAESAPFWEGIAAGRWLLCACTACGALRFPPSAVCAECGDPRREWVPTTGEGTLYASTVVHRPPSPFWQDLAPYAVGLIELDDGPRIMCTILADDLDALAPGLPVTLRFRPTSNGQQPYFTPRGDDR